MQYNEAPIMRRSTFVNWYANSGSLSHIRPTLRSLSMVCEKPLNCYVIRLNDYDSSMSDENLQKLNHEIDEVCSRFRKLMAFW